MTGISEIMAAMDYGAAREASAEGAAWIREQAAARHFIGGAFCDGGSLLPVLNPATGEALTHLPLARKAELAAAVDAARAALPLWEALGCEGRSRHLYAFARGLQKRERLFAEVEGLSTGRLIRDLREGDIPLAVRQFYHHAGAALLRDETAPGQIPYGLCAGLLSWTSPLLLAVGHLAPALAAGNVMVLKPSELTPLSAVLLAEVAQETGLPPGVLTLLQGDDETGALLAAHPEIRRLAVSGSARTARQVRQATAGQDKALSLHRGGTTTLIVLEDADPDAASEAVCDALCRSRGEARRSGLRLLVQEGIASDFTARLKTRMARLVTGDPLERGSDFGALTPADLVTRTRVFIARAMSDGAELFQSAAPEGNFVSPALLSGGPALAGGIPGPLAVLTTFRTPDEAVQLANHCSDSHFTSIWSENITRATDLAFRMSAPGIGLNCVNPSDAGAFNTETEGAGIAAFLTRPAQPESPDLRPAQPRDWSPAPEPSVRERGLDLTLRHWIGGKFTRAENGLSAMIGKGPPVASGSPKDIRNAVEAAVKATAWPALSGHQRAQVLWFLAENLQQREAEFAALTSGQEVTKAISLILAAAAAADQSDGHLRETRPGFLALQRPVPQGVIAILCPPEAPLLGLITLVAPALAMGNRVVCLPSETDPQAGAKLAQVFAVSDLPAGALNIVTGPHLPLAEVLAAHEEVQALWYCGTEDGSARAEALCAGNLKQIFTDGGNPALWSAPADLRRSASRTQRIWLAIGA